MGYCVWNLDMMEQVAFQRSSQCTQETGRSISPTHPPIHYQLLVLITWQSMDLQEINDNGKYFGS